MPKLWLVVCYVLKPTLTGTLSSLANAHRFFDRNNDSIDLLDCKIETAETELGRTTQRYQSTPEQSILAAHGTSH
jgi:hypothetical protein